MKKSLLIAALASYSFFLHAQPGALDVPFNQANALDYNGANSLAIQPDGKVLVGGSFSQKILRFQTDGTVDPSFIPLGNSFNSWIPALALQSDGKILVGGGFTEFNNKTTGGRIARLNSDASIDPTFKIGDGITTDGAAVYAIAVQPDGKIIVGGDFEDFNNKTQRRILRLNSDGSLDASFNAGGSGFNRQVNAIALQPDGKIVVGGVFWEYNGQSVAFRLTRLNSDGSVDATFNVGDGLDLPVTGIAIQPDGKIIVAGNFTSVNNVPKGGIARLNADGSIDASFNVGTGVASARPYVHTVFLQPDGKVLLGGQFTAYNGVTSNLLVRINSDGSLDKTFDIGTGCDISVNAFAVQADEKVLIVGEFTTYNGTPRKFLARLNGDNNIRNTIDTLGNLCNTPNVAIPFTANGVYNAGNVFTAQLSDENGNFSTPVNIGTLTGTTSGTIDATLPYSQASGTGYRVRVVSSNPVVNGYNNGKDLIIENIEPVVIKTNGFILSTAATYKTYQWYQNDTKITTATQSTYTVKQNGSYKVVVTNTKGCIDTSDAYKITNVPVNISYVESIAQQIRIFPNPAKEVIQINSPVKVNISVASLEGKLLLQQENAVQVAVNNLASGIYFLRITDQEGTLLKVEKFVKEK